MCFESTEKLLKKKSIELEKSKCKIALSELEDVRARASHQRIQPFETREAAEFAKQVRTSRSYGAFVRRKEAELRRLAADSQFSRSWRTERLSTTPFHKLFSIQTNTTRTTSSKLLYINTKEYEDAARRAAESNDLQLATVYWDIVEEIRAADNSIAFQPSLEEQDSFEYGGDDKLLLTVELVLSLLENIAWKAEVAGAFSGVRRRDSV